MKKIILTAIIIYAVSVCQIVYASGKHPPDITEVYRGVITNKTYDKDFVRHGAHGHYANAKLLKSVCGVESKLNNNVKSKAKANGLCQIMPKTWRYIASKNNIIPKHDTNVPKQSIAVATLVIDDAAKSWDKLPPGKNKTAMILASYNAGTTHIKEASKQCHSTTFKVVQRCLPNVTSSKKAKETINYVASVQGLYRKLPM